MARRPNRRAIKLHRNYTVDEAARALNISKGTVRRWLKSGLQAITDRKPILILGGELIDFLDGRSSPRKRCQLEECFCFSCRAPRKAAFGMAEFFPATATGGNLRALCASCSTIMHKRVSAAKLDALKAVLDVAIRQADRPIINGTEACLNDHFEQETQTHA